MNNSEGMYFLARYSVGVMHIVGDVHCD